MEPGRKAYGAGGKADDDGPIRIPSQQVLDEVGVALLSPAKATGPMRDALRELREALLCPLCGSVFTRPMTGPCGHSFCQTCIDAYSCNHFECPGRSLPGWFDRAEESDSTGCAKSLVSHTPSSCWFFVSF
jgi:RING-type zinc-finger